MNTPDRNKKNIEKMQKLGKVLDDSIVENKEELAKVALENVTREYPFPTARKIAWVFCGAFWLFCLGGFLFGVDMRALFPFLMFSLGAAVGLQIPVFFVKGKLGDTIIALIFTLSCMGLGISMLVKFGDRFF